MLDYHRYRFSYNQGIKAFHSFNKDNSKQLKF